MQKHAITLFLSAIALSVLLLQCSAAQAAAPVISTIEVAFSPNEGAEQLVVKTIDSAQNSIRMLAYSFTSAPVVAALVRAKKRHVDIAIVVDYKNNLVENRYGNAVAALNTLANAGVSIRTVSSFPIHHDKVIIVDRMHIETGSFNYSAAAASRNSENVIVVWNNSQLAKAYLQHWVRNWELGRDYSPAY